LDNIAQAAGRCNRENKRRRDQSIVTIFEPADPAMIPVFFRPAANATRHVLNMHAGDPLSPSAILEYFRSYSTMGVATERAVGSMRRACWTASSVPIVGTTTPTPPSPTRCR